MLIYYTVILFSYMHINHEKFLFMENKKEKKINGKKD